MVCSREEAWYRKSVPELGQVTTQLTARFQAPPLTPLSRVLTHPKHFDQYIRPHDAQVSIECFL